MSAEAAASPTFDEMQLQMIVLALAELALSRPGFDFAIREIAEKFSGGLNLFESLKGLNADRVRETHAPVVGPGFTPIAGRVDITNL